MVGQSPCYEKVEFLYIPIKESRYLLPATSRPLVFVLFETDSIFYFKSSVRCRKEKKERVF